MISKKFLQGPTFKELRAELARQITEAHKKNGGADHLDNASTKELYAVLTPTFKQLERRMAGYIRFLEDPEVTVLNKLAIFEMLCSNFPGNIDYLLLIASRNGVPEQIRVESGKRVLDLLECDFAKRQEVLSGYLHLFSGRTVVLNLSVPSLAIYPRRLLEMAIDPSLPEKTRVEATGKLVDLYIRFSEEDGIQKIINNPLILESAKVYPRRLLFLCDESTQPHLST